MLLLAVVVELTLRSPQIWPETQLAAGCEVKVMVVGYAMNCRWASTAATPCVCVSQESSVKSTLQHATVLCVCVCMYEVW